MMGHKYHNPSFTPTLNRKGILMPRKNELNEMELMENRALNLFAGTMTGLLHSVIEETRRLTRAEMLAALSPETSTEQKASTYLPKPATGKKTIKLRTAYKISPADKNRRKALGRFLGLSRKLSIPASVKKQAKKIAAEEGYVKAARFLKNYDKKPTVKKPAAKKPTAKKPAAKKTAVKKPTAKKTTVKKPTAKKPAISKPTDDSPKMRIDYE